jgi:hypothetical protein
MQIEDDLEIGKGYISKEKRQLGKELYEKGVAEIHKKIFG